MVTATAPTATATAATANASSPSAPIPPIAGPLRHLPGLVRPLRRIRVPGHGVRGCPPCRFIGYGEECGCGGQCGHWPWW